MQNYLDETVGHETVWHVFPRFLSQFSTDFHAILQGLRYFRVPRQIP